MAHKIENGFLKFVRGSPSEFVRRYLDLLASFSHARGLESVFWRQSPEALLKPETGYLSAGQYLDLCDELLLGVTTPARNSIRVTWILRKGDIQEDWWLRLVLSEIPYLQGDLLESTAVAVNQFDTWIKTQRQNLIESDIADIFFTRKELYGKPHWLYLHTKILKLKRLCAHMRESAWTGESPINDLAETSEVELSKCNPQAITVARKSIDAFVRASDKSLLESLGAQRFSELVKPTGHSLDEWLEDN